MTSVTKTVRFDAAHLLSGYEGACANLHGHTYRVDVTVSAPDAGEKGMVLDFRLLKRLLQDEVCGRFDHAFLYDEKAPAECEIAAVVIRLGLRAVALPFRTTSENLAREIFTRLAPRLVGLASVKVWETPDNCATYAP